METLLPIQYHPRIPGRYYCGVASSAALPSLPFGIFVGVYVSICLAYNNSPVGASLRRTVPVTLLVHRCLFLLRIVVDFHRDGFSTFFFCCQVCSGCEAQPSGSRCRSVQVMMQFVPWWSTFNTSDGVSHQEISLMVLRAWTKTPDVLRPYRTNQSLPNTKPETGQGGGSFGGQAAEGIPSTTGGDGRRTDGRGAACNCQSGVR